jgi:8-oxo-dGTP pyrophosphatase MutT (NUDIX family)
VAIELGPAVLRASYRVFSVYETAVKKDGVDLRPVYTLEHPDWCNVIAITEDERIVLVRQLRFGTRETSLELPGGMIDAGEDPAAAALRELREETGFEAARAELLVVTHPNPSFQKNKLHSFVARGARLAGATKFDEHEECETVLAPLSDVARMLDEGEIVHALDHMALSTFLRRR